MGLLTHSLSGPDRASLTTSTPTPTTPCSSDALLLAQQHPHTRGWAEASGAQSLLRGACVSQLPASAPMRGALPDSHSPSPVRSCPGWAGAEGGVQGNCDPPGAGKRDVRGPWVLTQTQNLGNWGS